MKGLQIQQARVVLFIVTGYKTIFKNRYSRLSDYNSCFLNGRPGLRFSTRRLLDENAWKVYLKAGYESYLNILPKSTFTPILRFDFCSVPRRLTNLNTCIDLQTSSATLSSRYSAICSSVTARNIRSQVFAHYISERALVSF